MTSFSEYLTRLFVFLATGPVFPLVFLSSLFVFRVVAVDVMMIVYICANFLSRYVFNSMILPVLHIVIHTTHSIIFASTFCSKVRKPRHQKSEQRNQASISDPDPATTHPKTWWVDQTRDNPYMIPLQVLDRR